MFSERLNNEPVFCFTSDMDWAEEKAIAHILRFFKKKKIPLTPFITHKSREIDTHYKNKEAEVGIHPNFLPQSTHGVTMPEVIEHARKLWPNAKSFRAHSYFDNLHITKQFYDLGFKYDSNLALHLQEGIRPLQHVSGLIRFPVFLEDYHYLRRQNEFDAEFVLESLHKSGLKIFNFHPIHTYLNTQSIGQYDAQKKGEEISVTAGENGVMDLLEQIIEKVQDDTGMGVFYLNDIYEIVKNDGGQSQSEYPTKCKEYISSTHEKKSEIVKQRYNGIKNHGIYATSRDSNLRELEIDFIIKTLSSQNNKDMKCLDIGCGNGYTDIRIACEMPIEITGLDFSANMIKNAKELSNKFNLKGTVNFKAGDATNLKIPNESFDCVITERCLLNLPSREIQYHTIHEIHRVLKEGGIYIMVEGTRDGLNRLNDVRKAVGLAEILDVAEDNISSLKFDESELEQEITNCFKIIEKKYFGMYYLISRVVHPLLIYPEEPRFNAKINEIARKITLHEPDYRKMGHIVGYILKKEGVLNEADTV